MKMSLSSGSDPRATSRNSSFLTAWTSSSEASVPWVSMLEHLVDVSTRPRPQTQKFVLNHTLGSQSFQRRIDPAIQFDIGRTCIYGRLVVGIEPGRGRGERLGCSHDLRRRNKSKKQDRR